MCILYIPTKTMKFLKNRLFNIIIGDSPNDSNIGCIIYFTKSWNFDPVQALGRNVIN